MLNHEIRNVIDSLNDSQKHEVLDYLLSGLSETESGNTILSEIQKKQLDVSYNQAVNTPEKNKSWQDVRKRLFDS